MLAAFPELGLVELVVRHVGLLGFRQRTRHSFGMRMDHTRSDLSPRQSCRSRVRSNYVLLALALGAGRSFGNRLPLEGLQHRGSNRAESVLSQRQSSRVEVRTLDAIGLETRLSFFRRVLRFRICNTKYEKYMDRNQGREMDFRDGSKCSRRSNDTKYKKVRKIAARPIEKPNKGGRATVVERSPQRRRASHRIEHQPGASFASSRILLGATTMRAFFL